VYFSGTRWKVLKKFDSLYVTHINTFTSNRLTILNDSTAVRADSCIPNTHPHDKAVCGGGRGTVKDMCYEVRRAEACVD